MKAVYTFNNHKTYFKNKLREIYLKHKNYVMTNEEIN